MARQRKNPVKDRYANITVTEEDYALAKAQDAWNCAIVCAIQRELPDSQRVRVTKDKISFSLQRDDMRYEFATPPEAVENVIKPFDAGEKPPVFSFSLVNPLSATPVQHRTTEENRKRASVQRITRRRTSKSATTRTYGRFLAGTSPE